MCVRWNGGVAIQRGLGYPWVFYDVVKFFFFVCRQTSFLLFVSRETKEEARRTGVLPCVGCRGWDVPDEGGVGNL